MGVGDTTVTLDDMRELLYSFSKERGWDTKYNPALLAKSIVIEAAELLEHYQKTDGKESFEITNDASEKNEVAWEIVDVLYYLLMLSKVLDIDLVSATKSKLLNLQKRYPAKP